MKKINNKELACVIGGNGELLAYSALCLVAGTAIGHKLAASHQDGYYFSGVRGSGFEESFMIALNACLEKKKKTQIQKKQLEVQKEILAKIRK